MEWCSRLFWFRLPGAHLLRFVVSLAVQSGLGFGQVGGLEQLPCLLAPVLGEEDQSVVVFGLGRCATLQIGPLGITSQNHGFAVDEASLPPTLRPTHVSLFDGTLQGVARTDRPAFSFQGHPEASPGPHDIGPLFDRFVALMKKA